jgi:Na+-driven multidrug efflux pump
MKPISILLGAEDVILNNCVLYGRIILLALPFLVLQYLFQSFMIAAEKPKLGLYVTIVAGCTNMILDAILVMLLPKELKLAGAAIATAFSQFLGGVIPLIYFLTNKTTDLKLGKTKLYLKPIVKACINGSSEFMSNVSMNIVGMIYNLQLIKYAGDDGIAAYGVMMYLSFIFAGIFIGYSIGCAPIVSYNFGAKNFEELKNIRRKGIILVGITGMFMVLIAELFAIPLSKMFVSYNKELLDMTVHGFRIFTVSFPFMGYAIFGSGFFTALNDGITSAIISFFITTILLANQLLKMQTFLNKAKKDGEPSVL